MLLTYNKIYKKDHDNKSKNLIIIKKKHSSASIKHSIRKPNKKSNKKYTN